MGKRIEWIDEVKGFAILLMVMGHAIAWSFEDYNVLQFSPAASLAHLKAGALWQMIYSFHMPLFFCVSGFFLYKEQYSWGG